MKTAIFIPDEVFDAAEDLTKKLGWSRSRLYAQAVQSFVQVKIREDVTQALNKIYAKEASGLEPPLIRMQGLSCPDEKW